jgi:hypothetical protein
MMNAYSDVPRITSLANAAKVLGFSKRELMQMSAEGRIVVREINGRFFVETDSVKKMIQEAPIVKFDDGPKQKQNLFA